MDEEDEAHTLGEFSDLYQVFEANVSPKERYLVPFKQPKRSGSIFSSLINFCKTTLKRRFYESVSSDSTAMLMKKPRIDHDRDGDCLSEDTISHVLLNPLECVLIIKHHAWQILRLKEEFAVEEKNVETIVKGVTKSRLLILGNVHTTFITLQPQSSTDFSICNYDVNFILYEGEAVTLKIMSRVEGEGLQEEGQTLEREPFQLLRGTSYSLHNQHPSQRVLLRLFWAV